MGGGASKPPPPTTENEIESLPPIETISKKDTVVQPELGLQELDLGQENADHLINIPTVEAGYPTVKPPFNKRADILKPEDIIGPDHRARQIKAEDVTTVKELAKRLTEGFTKDVQHVRAIFSWIGAQNLQEMNFPPEITPLSPLEILYKMKHGKSSYTLIFTLLCRSINIPCAIIHGYAKSAGYEVGDKNIEGLHNTWNAVYVSGGWRIVFPLWACRVVVGHSTGKWTLVETKGKGVREKEHASTGVAVSTLNEYYFLTDPEEFIYRCFPRHEMWQLIKNPISKQEFIDIPYCRPPYFENKFKILTTQKCVLESENGLCSVVIKSAKNEDLLMTYELFYNEEESEESISSEIQLDKYVAVLNQKSKVTFNIRFPSSGIYKMDIQGGVYGGDISWLCSFKMISKTTQMNVKPYPCNPDLGFGPNAVTENIGLKAKTHKDGKIGCHQNKEVEIKFKMKQKLHIRTMLVHNTFTPKQLQQYVAHRIVGDQLTVSVGIPQKGEYGLQISAKGRDDTEYRNVCNYLLETTEQDKKRRSYETPTEKKARSQLQIGLNSKNPEEIQKAIDRFSQCDLDDHGELKRAQDRIEFLKLSKGLRDGINRRNIEAIEDSLKHAKSSEFQHKLRTLIKHSEGLLADLRKIKRYAHEVLQLKQSTISELHRYKKAPQVLFDVMKATYILLGEDSENMEDWFDVQVLMRKSGRESLIYRVNKFDTVHIDENAINAAAQLLKLHDEDAVRTASAGCGTFYIWANRVVSDLLGNSKDAQEPGMSENVDTGTSENQDVLHPNK